MAQGLSEPYYKLSHPISWPTPKTQGPVNLIAIRTDLLMLFALFVVDQGCISRRRVYPFGFFMRTYNLPYRQEFMVIDQTEIIAPGLTHDEIYEIRGQYRASIPNIRGNAYRKAYDRALAGSKAAGIRLKCLDCMNWQAVEIRNCPIVACPLYVSRPYRPGRKDKKPISVTQAP